MNQQEKEDLKNICLKNPGYEKLIYLFTNYPKIKKEIDIRNVFDLSIPADDTIVQGVYNFEDAMKFHNIITEFTKAFENDVVLFEILLFNYSLRRQEQVFINKSVKKMKESIRDFLAYSLSHNFDGKNDSKGRCTLKIQKNILEIICIWCLLYYFNVCIYQYWMDWLPTSY